jgi:hypothetical protein
LICFQTNAVSIFRIPAWLLMLIVVSLRSLFT